VSRHTCHVRSHVYIYTHTQLHSVVSLERDALARRQSIRFSFRSFGKRLSVSTGYHGVGHSRLRRPFGHVTHVRGDRLVLPVHGRQTKNHASKNAHEPHVYRLHTFTTYFLVPISTIPIALRNIPNGTKTFCSRPYLAPVVF